VGHAGAFDPALLASLTSLCTIKVHSCTTVPSTLKHLSSLTGLQHLGLDCRPPAGATAGSTADVTALTASSKLTHLSLGEGLVQHNQYSHLFAQPGRSRQLSLLQHLSASMGLLASLPTVRNMRACCPELQSLCLSHFLDEPAVERDLDGEFEEEWHSWSPVHDLHKLTKLHLCVRGVEVCEMAWYALEGLWNLRELSISKLRWEDIAGVMSLDLTCLTYLMIGVGSRIIKVVNKVSCVAQ